MQLQSAVFKQQLKFTRCYDAPTTVSVLLCRTVVMKRSKSYTWLSGLLRQKPDEREDQDHEEWGAVPWVRADVMHHDRLVKEPILYYKFTSFKLLNVAMDFWITMYF